MKNKKTSHVQSCRNVLNEDTSVAGEQELYPHSCGWKCKRSGGDGVRGRLRAKDDSEIVAHTLYYVQLLRQWGEDRSYI